MTLRLTIFLCIAFAIQLNAQNLVPNGSFEKHLPFDKHGVRDYTTQRIVSSWRDHNQGTSAYCHKDLIRQYGYDREKWGRWFRFDTNQVQDGDAMVKFYYGESCPVGDTGCTMYLTNKLIEPLMIGEVYEVSLWVYPEVHVAPDTAIYSRIGIYLTRKPVPPYGSGYEEMLPVDYFFSGQVVPSQWTQIKWYIRALCSLEHVTIGMFRDSSFKSLYRQTYETSMHWFFIDNVSIVKVHEDSIPSDVVLTPYCEYFEKQHKKHLLNTITSTDVHFPSNQYELDDIDKAGIDSFYLANKERQDKVFIVIGHTDDQQAENVILSQNRATSVKQYMVEKFALPGQSILAYGFGASDPKSTNASASGRTINRRATIRTSDITIPQLMYRQVLEAISQDSLPKANARLLRWLRLAPRGKHVEMLTDPRLFTLKRSQYWKWIVAEVRKSYVAFKDNKSAFYLDSLYFEDQRYRTPDYYDLSGRIEEIDTVVLPEFKFTESKALAKDSINLLAALRFFEKNGYPAFDKVGRRPARGFGYIILHCGKEEVYDKFIPVVEQLCKEGEADWSIFAMMNDKRSVGRGEPQRYGTQYRLSERKELVLCEVDDIEKVNWRRMRIGLTPVGNPD
jgi:hypothetical protein